MSNTETGPGDSPAIAEQAALYSTEADRAYQRYTGACAAFDALRHTDASTAALMAVAAVVQRYTAEHDHAVTVGNAFAIGVRRAARTTGTVTP